MGVRHIYERGGSVTLDFLLNEQTKVVSWEDAYWLGKCAALCNDTSVDKTSMEIIKLSFNLGLNIQSDREKYLDSVQRISRLYYQYGNHSASCRMFMILDAYDDTPDWVHINYASAQIHTNNIFRIALNPTMFIRRLQRADGADPSVLNQRTAVYREFLALCNSIYENDNTIQIDLAGITRGAQYFGLSDCIELKRLTALVRNEKLPNPESEKGTSKVNDDANYAQVEALLKELAVKAEILDDMEEEKKELSLRVEELVAQNAQLASSKGDLEFLRQQNEQAKLELQKKDEAIDRLAKRVDDLLSQLNRLLPQSSGTSQRKKLLVIGASQVSADRLSGIAKHYGFDKRNIEFWLDYDKLTSKLASLQYNSAYSGIIVGPTPHKAAGNDGYSSPLARLKQEGYPYTVEARSKSGELKITVDTFRSALEQMDAYLKSGGIN